LTCIRKFNKTVCNHGIYNPSLTLPLKKGEDRVLSFLPAKGGKQEFSSLPAKGKGTKLGSPCQRGGNTRTLGSPLTRGKVGRGCRIKGN